MRLINKILKYTKPWPATPISSVWRSLSGQNSMVDLAVDNEGIATLTMQRPPVNTLNLELLQEMNKMLDEVAKLRVKGAILTSAMPTVFSAGLDIMEMYKPDLQRVEIFWTAVQDLSIKLFSSDFVTAAAINGQAPAAGCLLALMCEYRAMVDGNYVIGMNEAALGIVATPWIQAITYHTIPIKEAERALTAAKLFTPNEAVTIGLIDDVVSDKNTAVEFCKQFIRKFENIPANARASTKRLVRAAPLKIMHEKRREDMKLFLDLMKNPEVQNNLEIYVEKLKQKNKKLNV